MDHVAVLVTGSREMRDPALLAAAIADVCQRAGLSSLPTLLVHGDSPLGADRRAAEWAERHQVPAVPMPAQWQTLGRRAGPARNTAMVQLCKQLRACGWLVLVIAFPAPASKGTRHCIDIAEKAGFAVAVHPIDDDGIRTP